MVLIIEFDIVFAFYTENELRGKFGKNFIRNSGLNIPLNPPSKGEIKLCAQQNSPFEGGWGDVKP